MPNHLPLKIAYIQGWGTYPYDTLVVVGHSTKEELVAAADLAIAEGKQKRAALKEIRDDDSIAECMADSKGFFLWFDSGRSLLWLKAWPKNGWYFLDTLNHEVAHAVDAWAKHISITEETEARAYQHEYLFREIRRALYASANSVLTPKKKKP